MDINFFDIATTVDPTRGDLLISEPFLPDPNFDRAVIYLCEHDSQGSLGYILNKKAQVNFGEALDDFAFFEKELYIGGPVQQETLHFLHRDFDRLQSGKEVKNGIHWGGNFEKVLENIDNRLIDHVNYQFFLGYSGWSEGQLTKEIKAKSWIVFKNAPEDLVFDVAAEDMWREALRRMGGRYKMFANYPTDPRLN